MDDLLKRYEKLSIELQFARKIIRDLEKHIKQFPPRCPVRKLIQQNIDSAHEIRRDIQADINKLADSEINYFIKFPTR